MRLNLKGTNITLSDYIRDYLDKRLQGLAKIIDLDDPAVMIDVELARTTRHHEKGYIFRAEINITRGKESFRAAAECEDLNTAIDAMRDEIAREVASDKGRKRSLLRRGGAMAKELLRSGYEGLGEWVGEPAKKGFRKLKNFRPWRK